MVTLLVLAMFFQFINPVFLTGPNIETMLRAMSYTGLIALGMGLCLISGIIDLSVGATAGFVTMWFSTSLTNWHWPVALAVITSLCIGAAFGLFNAFVILKLKVTPFIATISTMFIYRGMATAWTNGFQVYPLPEGMNEFGMLEPLGVNWAFVIFVILAVAAYIVLDHTVFGLEIRATGSDYEVAKVTEVRYILVHVMVLMCVGVLAAIAGMLLSMMLNAGIPTAGTGWEFMAITACAIGGVSLFGYEGSIFGIVCGLLVMQVLQNGIIMIGVNPYLQTSVIGLVLLLAITLDVKRRTYLNLESL
jgi:ribose transport system permease protein